MFQHQEAAVKIDIKADLLGLQLATYHNRVYVSNAELDCPINREIMSSGMEPCGDMIISICGKACDTKTLSEIETSASAPARSVRAACSVLLFGDSGTAQRTRAHLSVTARPTKTQC